jgi:hypothetical protein
MTSTFRLFVDGLVGETNASNLKSTFGQFGDVTEVQSIDHKGFSYVTLCNTDESRVRKCIFALNSTKWRGKHLRLEIAKPEFQERLKKRHQEDEDQEKEKMATKLAKIERRNKATLLPPPRIAKTSAVEGDDFVPSYPYGWALVRGRYLPIVRLGRKGREGGIVVDPKTYASSKQNILCHVKPLRVDKILTELPPNTEQLDEMHKEERKLEVDRWARGLYRQRASSGDPIQTLEEYLKDVRDTEISEQPRRRKRIDEEDDDFEVVGGDASFNDGYFEVGSSASFSDLEEMMDKANSRKGAKTDSKPQRASSAPSSSKAVDSKASMLDVINSILSNKKGSDYGDSDSEDFEMHPSSGESSEEEHLPSYRTGKAVPNDSDLESGDSDADEDSNSEISANSFHEGDAELDAPVVDFSSDSDEDEQPGNDESSEEKSENEEKAPSDSESESLSFEGEYDDVSSSSDTSEVIEPKKKDSSRRPIKTVSETSSEAYDKDIDDEEFSEGSELSEEEDNEEEKSKMKAKRVEMDEDDDINIHIITPAPKSKSKPKTASDMDVDDDKSVDSSLDEDLPAKRGRKRVWAADLQEGNKKYAYSELVREEDEKIFSMMRDAPDSAPKHSFRFLPERASSSEQTPSAPPSAGFTFLSRGVTPTSGMTSESASLLAALDTRLSQAASSTSTSFKSTSIDSSNGRTVSPATAASKVTPEQKAQMFLFSMGNNRSSSATTSTSSPSKPPASSSSFVRGTQVDKIQKMWSGTKDAQRQQAQRNHKLASKRVKKGKV